MKQIMILLKIGLRQITKDGMLLILLPAPILIGLLFRLAVPFVNDMLIEKISFSLLPWYGLVDGMLIYLTPMFVAMISAFQLIEERDEGIGAFYQITPIQGYAYLTARIGIPMLWAFITTIVVAIFFSISGLTMGVILSSSLISALTGIDLSMLIVSLAENRVEGLALSKLMGVSSLGLILIWFIPAPYYFFAAFLPSFWIGKLLMDGTSFFSFMLGLLTCSIWIIFFLRRFLSKIE